MSRHRRQQRKRARARLARLVATIAPLARKWQAIVARFAEHYRSGRPMSYAELVAYELEERAHARAIAHAEHSA